MPVLGFTSLGILSMTFQVFLAKDISLKCIYLLDIFYQTLHTLEVQTSAMFEAMLSFGTHTLSWM